MQNTHTIWHLLVVGTAPEQSAILRRASAFIIMGRPRISDGLNNMQRYYRRHVAEIAVRRALYQKQHTKILSARKAAYYRRDPARWKEEYRTWYRDHKHERLHYARKRTAALVDPYIIRLQKQKELNEPIEQTRTRIQIRRSRRTFKAIAAAGTIAGIK